MDRYQIRNINNEIEKYVRDGKENYSSISTFNENVAGLIKKLWFVL